MPKLSSAYPFYYSVRLKIRQVSAVEVVTLTTFQGTNTGQKLSCFMREFSLFFLLLNREEKKRRSGFILFARELCFDVQLMTLGTLKFSDRYILLHF